MKKNFIKINRYLFILFFLFQIVWSSYLYYQKQYHALVMKKLQVNDFTGFLGYIEIPSLSIQREIVLGMTDDHLNQNYVTLEHESSLDVQNGHFLLAGHANMFVFSKLKNIKLNEPIDIVTSKSRYHYIVTSVYKQRKDEPILIRMESIRTIHLITCDRNPNYRWVVSAKEK